MPITGRYALRRNAIGHSCCRCHSALIYACKLTVSCSHTCSKALENSACIDIKKRSGCLSHLEDPDRLKSLFAQTLTTEQFTCWHVNATALERFSNDPFVTSFTDRFLHIDAEIITQDELLKIQQLTMLFYNAVIKDKMHVLPIYLTTFNVSKQFGIFLIIKYLISTCKLKN